MDTTAADKKPKKGKFVCFFNKFTILPLYFLGTVFGNGHQLPPPPPPKPPPENPPPPLNPLPPGAAAMAEDREPEKFAILAPKRAALNGADPEYQEGCTGSTPISLKALANFSVKPKTIA